MNTSDWLFKKLAMMGEKFLQRRLVVKASENGIFADILTLKTLNIYVPGRDVLNTSHIRLS